MSAFNTVVVPWIDPQSSQQTELRVQFKFGDTWQYEYHLGDRIKWGGNDIGPRDAKYVIADGCLEGTPPQGLGEDFEVHIRDGVIERVVPTSGTFNLQSAEESYIVIESGE